MSAYLLAQLTFKNLAAYRRYQAAFPAVFARFGGKVLVADERPNVLEGDWRGDKVVLLQFPDPDAARRFAESDDYRAIAEDRRAGAEGPVLLLTGLAP